MPDCRLKNCLLVSAFVFFHVDAKCQEADSVPKNITLNFQSVPEFSRNIRRIELIAYYPFTDASKIHRINYIINNYCNSKFGSVKNFSVAQMADSLHASLQINHDNMLNEDARKAISDNIERDVLYSLSSVKLFSSESEEEININSKSISRDFIALGYDDFENDFMPFLARILAEHHERQYQGGRVKPFSSESEGIVTPMDIVNAHRDPGLDIRSGACRDVSELALRIMRQSFEVYYNEMQKNNFNPDDFIFIQGWMTPLSQHVTVLMIDPHNPRNGYDLDWGRVYERKNQEGIETPNNLGTDIRLWKFDQKKDHTIPLMLLKTDKGHLLDKNILSAAETRAFNSPFYKTFYSDVKLEKSVNSHIYWNASAGKLNDNLYYMLGSISYRSRELHLGRHFSYYGKAALQPHYYENSEVQKELIPWKNWYSSHNIGLFSRYIARIESRNFQIIKNVSFRIISHSQIYLLMNVAKYYTDFPYDQGKIFTSGDGNILTTYGGKISYSSAKEKIRIEMLFQRRNYLTTKEVRLLSPNPFVLIENARLVCSANNIIADVVLKLKPAEIKLTSVYEYDILKTQLLQNEISLSRKITHGIDGIISFGFNKQLTGMNYYWYPQNKMWVQTGCRVSKWKATINGYFCTVKGSNNQAGASVQKYF